MKLTELSFLLVTACATVTIAIASNAPALPDPRQQAEKQHYTTVQVLPLAVEPGVTVPDEYLKGTMAQIIENLKKANRFELVTEAPSDAGPAKSTVRIAGTVTKFVPGSRAKRMLIGMGAGATKITVHVVFTDAESGKVLIERDVHGLVWYGSPALGGASSNNAQRAWEKKSPV